MRSSKGADLIGVAYGNDRFIAIAKNSLFSSSPAILISNDGVKWEFQDTEIDSYDRPVTIAYGNGLFVAVDNYDRIYTSPDGVKWTTKTLPGLGDFVTRDIKALTYANGLFVAVGEHNSDNTPSLVTSPDGVNWTDQALDVKVRGAFNGVAYGNNQFVAVGEGMIFSSPDGVKWVPQIFWYLQDFKAVTYGNGRFVVLEKRGTILTSP